MLKGNAFASDQRQQFDKCEIVFLILEVTILEFDVDEKKDTVTTT